MDAAVYAAKEINQTNKQQSTLHCMKLSKTTVPIEMEQP
jgi:hypothetical protein